MRKFLLFMVGAIIIIGTVGSLELNFIGFKETFRNLLLGFTLTGLSFLFPEKKTARRKK